MKLINKIRDLADRWMHDSDYYSELIMLFKSHPEFKSDEILDIMEKDSDLDPEVTIFLLECLADQKSGNRY